ncbi:hypothetical protein BCR39DRAFT_520775 [Naematelia encephala]|uniref:Uncharacterized protein n=1 Tax=Naematelia encephala TaxID=71784 RepID=A0A1Y2BDV2_9TREE|nr:hypothetical protein BCR39DRAFT_520775 [Naematelia encephala]
MQNQVSRAASGSKSWTSTRPIKPRRRFGFAYLARLQRASYPKNILIDGVPHTSLPNDVLRALKESRIVSHDFPITSISPPPISLPRTPSLTRTYHLSFGSSTEAISAFEKLKGLTPPLFPLHAFESTLHTAPPSVEFTLDDPSEWRVFCMRDHERHLQDTIQRRGGGGVGGGDRNRGGEAGGIGGGGGGVGRSGNSIIDNEEFDLDWMEKNQPSRGRRVLVKGLPRLLPSSVAAALSKDFEMEQEVKRLPWGPGRSSSLFVYSFTSVADAYRFARATNMVHYVGQRDANKLEFLMRAHVVW